MLGYIPNEGPHVISKRICKHTLYLGHYTRKAYDKKHEPRYEADRVWNWRVKAQDEQKDMDPMKTSKELGSVVPATVSRDTD